MPNQTQIRIIKEKSVVDMGEYDPSILQAEADKFNPKHIKRFVNGKYRVFSITDVASDFEAGYVALKDVETQEMYDGVMENGKIEVTSKAEMIYPRSIEEFYYIMYGKKI